MKHKHFRELVRTHLIRLKVSFCVILTNKDWSYVMFLSRLKDTHFQTSTEYCLYDWISGCIAESGGSQESHICVQSTKFHRGQTSTNFTGHRLHLPWLDASQNSSGLISLSVSALTDKVLHHGGVVMRRRSQTQQLLTSRHSGVVDGLDVDVVSLQQNIAHLSVQLSVAHLQSGSGKGDIRTTESRLSHR